MGTFSERAHRLKTGETLTIRCAGPDDAFAVLAHSRGVIGEGEFGVTCPDEFNVTEAQERDQICRYAEEAGNVFLVAQAQGQIIGVLAVESAQRRRLAHCATFYMTVETAWRSRGVGTALLQSAIDWANLHPTIEKLCLAVFATNDRAIGLYRKMGFVEEGRRIREIKIDSEQYIDDVLMYRFVDGAKD
jgi:RimJ/RimL family protein N-acetyltransferase